MSKYCEQCAEISMWNLYKDMSFAAKCKCYERKIKFLPVTSQVKVIFLKYNHLPIASDF